jgi:hypothetical protein
MHEPRPEASAFQARPLSVALDVPLAPPAPALPEAIEKPGERAHRWALRRARGISEALFSSETGAPPAERLDWLSGELRQFLDRAGWRSGGFYKLGLIVVTLLAPLLILRPRALWRLPLADRVRALRKMEKSFAASVLLAVKAILCILYYEHPDAAREAGYTGGCHPKVAG